jgi:hypothetical protein
MKRSEEDQKCTKDKCRKDNRTFNGLWATAFSLCTYFGIYIYDQNTNKYDYINYDVRFYDSSKIETLKEENKMKTKGLTIQEAINSGKWYKQMDDAVWTSPKADRTFNIKQITSSNWQIQVEKKTKRYWLWDIKADSGYIYKCPTYLDEQGEDVRGATSRYSGKLIKKHENEFIDIEEEE